MYKLHALVVKIERIYPMTNNLQFSVRNLTHFLKFGSYFIALLFGDNHGIINRDNFHAMGGGGGGSCAKAV